MQAAIKFTPFAYTEKQNIYVRGAYMKIHTVTRGESIRSVAEQYGVPESRILFDNELDTSQKLYPMQTLVIGEPTRTDSVRGGDTPERIAARNDTDVLALLQNNPRLAAAGLVPAQPLNIEYDKGGERPIFVHAYSGTASDAALQKRLPLISALSVQNAALLQSGKLQLLDAAARIAALARKFRAQPILCIEANDAYGRYDAGAVSQILSAPRQTERFIQSAMHAAKAGGFNGMELDFLPTPGGDGARLCELTLALAGLCEESGLHLFLPWLPNLPQAPTVAESQMDTASLVPMQSYLYDNGKAASAAAPLDRMREALSKDFAVRYAKKLLLGIPTFGIDYTRAANGYRKRAVEADTHLRSLAPPPEIEFDEAAMAPRATYNENVHHAPTPHTLCFEDARAFAAKLELAKQFGLCGVSVCSLGYDAPLFWQVLNQTCTVAKC